VPKIHVISDETQQGPSTFHFHRGRYNPKRHVQCKFFKYCLSTGKCILVWYEMGGIVLYRTVQLHSLQNSLEGTEDNHGTCQTRVYVLTAHSAQWLSYWLEDRSSNSCKVESFLLSKHHTSSGAVLASYSMCTGAHFRGGKVAGEWSWPLTSI